MAAKKKAQKGDDEGKKKGGLVSKLKPVLMIVAAVGGYKFFLAPKPAATPAAEVSAAAVAAPEEGSIVTMPELVLNLAGPKQTYLRVGAALVLEKGVDPKTMEADLPLASDVLVDVLSAKTPDELNQPDAKTALKKELSDKVRAAYHDKKVVRVIFTTFVMQ